MHVVQTNGRLINRMTSIGAIDKDIKEIMAEAVTFAKESPEPDEAELWTDILVA